MSAQESALPPGLYLVSGHGESFARILGEPLLVSKTADSLKLMRVTHANIALSTAAPDLLGAVNLVIAHMEREQADLIASGHEYDAAALDALRLAVAKAVSDG